MSTCLIADDSEVVRKVAGRILFQMGFTVENAASGAQALEAATSEPLAELMIVSAALSDVSAEEIVRAARARPGGDRSLILAALVEANLGQMTRLKRAGAAGFVFKPFDRRSLTEAVERHMRQFA